MTSVPQAAISEIYPSIQGEGPFTGQRQVFIRLAGCPLRCDYCDTPGSLVAKGHPLMSVNDVVEKAVAIARAGHIQTVSLTGGEPLAHTRFVKPLAHQLKRAGLNVYLETAGIHPAALRSVLKDVDVVSMDFKLPSATGKSYWEEHDRFLCVAGTKAFVKVVIESHSTVAELDKVLAILKRRRSPPKLILQPVTPQNKLSRAPTPDQLAELFSRASALLPQVAVMPQQHKIWGIR